jgi:energy-coupling factor transport system substrate-specific component
VRAVRLGPRSVAVLVLVSAVGLAAFGWPLLAGPTSQVSAHAQDAPWLFAVLLVLLVAVVAAAVSGTGLGAKAVAMLGVLAATGAALRPLGAGTAGIEPMFFLMVLSGRVLGPGFGLVLGAVTMFASALLTGGVGPWMPFQMLSMGWFTMGAGLLPGPDRLRGRGEALMLGAYGFLAALAYGTIMNLAGWPFMDTLASGVSFAPDAPLFRNLARFIAYCLATSLGWDLGRAVLTIVLTLTLGPTVLKALRRATRRAAFETPVAFDDTLPHRDRGTHGTSLAYQDQGAHGQRAAQQPPPTGKASVTHDASVTHEEPEPAEDRTACEGHGSGEGRQPV